MLDISKHEFLCMVGKLGPPVSTNFSAGPPPIFHGASNFFFMGPPSHFFGASNQKARGGRGLPGLPPEYTLVSLSLSLSLSLSYYYMFNVYIFIIKSNSVNINT